MTPLPAVEMRGITRRFGDLVANGGLAGYLWIGLLAAALAGVLMGLDLPFEALLALPYLATILALAGRNVSSPGAYLKPYRRE